MALASASQVVNGDKWGGYDNIEGAGESDDSRDDRGIRGKGGLAAVGSLAMADAGGGLLSVLALAVAGMKLGFMSFQRGAPWNGSTDFASENYSQLSDLLVGHPTAVDEQVKGITVSPDRSRMAFVKEDGSVVLWDLARRQPSSLHPHSIRRHEQHIPQHPGSRCPSARGGHKHFRRAVPAEFRPRLVFTKAVDDARQKRSFPGSVTSLWK